MNNTTNDDELSKTVLWMCSPVVVTAIAYGINSLWAYAGAMAYLGWFYWMINRKP